MATYKIDEAFWQGFVAYARENGLKISSNADADDTFTAAELAEARPVLEVILKARIAQRLYLSEAWFPVFNSIDPTIQEALRLWGDAETLTLHHRPAGGGNG